MSVVGSFTEQCEPSLLVNMNVRLVRARNILEVSRKFASECRQYPLEYVL